MSPTDAPKPTGEEQAERARALLDAMAETWVERMGVAQSIRSIPVNCSTPEFQDRAYRLILRWVKQAYVEGLYTGHTSTIDEIGQHVYRHDREPPQ